MGRVVIFVGAVSAVVLALMLAFLLGRLSAGPPLPQGGPFPPGQLPGGQLPGGQLPGGELPGGLADLLPSQEPTAPEE